EARAKRRGERIVPGLERTLLKPLLKNEQDGGAGEVAYISKYVPGRLGVLFVQTHGRLDVAEQARATGVQDPALDVLASLAVSREKPVDQSCDLPADQLGNIFREQDVEAGIAQVEAHGAERVRERVGLRDQNLRPARLGLRSYQHRGGSVAEQDRR